MASDLSIADLTKYIPYLESVSVVPVGLTKYRNGLYPLEPFDNKDAVRVIGQIESWQEKLYKKHGTHFVHASDEWYLIAGMPLPEADRYDGYLQLENGVGMVRLLKEEISKTLKKHGVVAKRGSFSIATGSLIYPVISDLTYRMHEYYPNISVMVYPIRNDFFGESVTVAGLLTGQDIVAQLRGRDLGERLYLPENLLRFNTKTLLDDMTLSDIEDALQVPVGIVKSDGAAFVGMYDNA